MIATRGFGFFQDRNVGIGVFPEGKEVFVGGESADAGSVGVCTLISASDVALDQQNQLITMVD
ncbi:MAG TPA: hypothetical protein VEI01_02830 [Terriglobales bacterium]|nr:hypothetical protein [Terriglobales bacterium]